MVLEDSEICKDSHKDELIKQSEGLLGKSMSTETKCLLLEYNK